MLTACAGIWPKTIATYEPRLLRARGDDCLGDVLGRLRVMLELHRVGGPTLRHRTQRRRVAEHLGERHLGLDRLAGREVVHALDHAAR